MNKEIIKERFSKASNTYNNHALAQKIIIDKLIHFTKENGIKEADNVFEIGCGTGLMTKEIINHFFPKNLIVNDICENQLSITLNESDYKENNIQYIQGDAEYILFPEKNNLILSSSAIQWLNDLDSFFSKIQTSITKDGIFAFSTFGKDNLKEIKSITGNGLDYKSKEEINNHLSKYFDIIFSFQEDIVLNFESPKQVLTHLKLTGVNSLSNKTWTKKDLIDFTDSYNKEFKNSNGVSLSYNPIYFIAKRKN